MQWFKYRHKYLDYIPSVIASCWRYEPHTYKELTLLVTSSIIIAPQSIDSPIQTPVIHNHRFYTLDIRGSDISVIVQFITRVQPLLWLIIPFSNNRKETLLFLLQKQSQTQHKNTIWNFTHWQYNRANL